jgi:N-sulfoglucosamine sulfohydrolase
MILRLLLVLSVSLASSAFARPNAIFFIADDVSWDDLGCYGNTAARTPNLDRLAANGLRFDEAFLTASSCSPSRSSIITSRYPHNNGRASELHQPIAAHLPWFPRLLKDAGYYTALVGKNHMSSDTPDPGQPPQPASFDLIDNGIAPGNKGGHATWVKTLQDRPKDKPFFFWFASLDAHRAWDADTDWNAGLYGPKHRPEDVRVPPFLRDDPATREDLASYYNEITRFDHFVGEVVKELQAQGQLDDTLIFVAADNARAFPRAKTRLHDSGMKTYLIAHWPKAIAKPGSTCSSLVSTIDLAPTYLAAAGLPVPDTFQGVSLLPLFANPATTVRQHAFSEHNWHDYEAHGRAVRSEGFLYIRNQRPQYPWQGPADSVRSPSHTSLRAARDTRQLTPAQADVFLAPRPAEELYRTAADPDQLLNLATDPNYTSVKSRLANLIDQWTEQTGDDTPAKLSQDGFDRESGESLKIKKNAYRGTPAGWNRNASRTNHPGPR